MYFRNGLKMESYVTDNTTLEELTSEVKGKKKPTHHHPPSPLLPTYSPFTCSGRLAVFQIHF